jgi:tRNA(Ile)-lysidine synthase TilS/MesJ
LFLLSIDEGISGYRDDSLETVKRNEQTYGIPLKVCTANAAAVHVNSAVG